MKKKTIKELMEIFRYEGFPILAQEAQVVRLAAGCFTRNQDIPPSLQWKSRAQNFTNRLQRLVSAGRLPPFDVDMARAPALVFTHMDTRIEVK